MFWTIASILAAIPLVLWICIDPSLARFSNFPLAITSLGQIAGLLGLTLFAYNIFISSRMKWQEKIFGPLNRIYISHHLMGAVVWVLLMIHPLGLLSTYGLHLLLPTYGNWARNLGEASLLCLDALLILTFYVKMPYQIWRFSHKFMGVVFMMGATHALFVSTDIAYYLPLKIFVIIILIIGSVCYFYRTVFGRFLVPRSTYKVQTVTPLSDKLVTEIVLSPMNNALQYQPGQFMFVTFEYPPFSETHPFSISSSPSEPNLMFSAKASGDYTSILSSLPVGTIAKIEGPFGRFSYAFTNRTRHVWIAGGIGITPFLSMAKNLPITGFQVDLYYVVKNKTEAVYFDKLNSISNPCVKLHLIETETIGRLTAETVSKDCGDLTKSEIFICGPSPMMKSFRSQFNAMGIRHSHIHTEEFSLN